MQDARVSNSSERLSQGHAASQLRAFCAVGVKVLTCFSAGDSTCGQRAIYHGLGLTGIPIVNVNNNCSTGSTALFMARQLIQGGKACLLIIIIFKVVVYFVYGCFACLYICAPHAVTTEPKESIKSPGVTDGCEALNH